MAPVKRKLDALNSPGKATRPIELDDSDSDVMVVDPPANGHGASSSKPLTGLKLWNSHVHLFEQLYGASTLRLTPLIDAGAADGEPIKSLRKGDSDGMIELKIPPAPGSKRPVRLTLMVINPDSYPTAHSLTTWTDDDVSDAVNGGLELLGDQGALTLEAGLRFVLKRVSNANLTSTAAATARLARSGRALAPSTSQVTDGGAADAEDDDDEFDEPDNELFGLDVVHGGSGLARDKVARAVLRNDLEAVVRNGWQPGLSRANDFKSYLSITVPISSLNVPVQALNARDVKVRA